MKKVVKFAIDVFLLVFTLATMVIGYHALEQQRRTQIFEALLPQWLSKRDLVRKFYRA